MEPLCDGAKDSSWDRLSALGRHAGGIVFLVVLSAGYQFRSLVRWDAAAIRKNNFSRYAFCWFCSRLPG